MPASVDPAVAVLELTASTEPRLVDFLLKTFLESPQRSAVYELASAFDVPHEEVGLAVREACRGLDKLEKRRGPWREPATILDSPNVTALYYACLARLRRFSHLARGRRLEVILSRLAGAHELARSKAWIEAFIGPPLDLSPRTTTEPE